MQKERKLSKKQLGFAKDYLDTGNGTQSALKNYDTTDDKVAGVIASQNLRKLSVIEYLQANSEAVSSNMVKLALSAESEQVQVAAGKDVLDRAGYKPVDQSEVKGNFIITTLTESEKEHLDNLLLNE